ncbi:MAG: T9SS type A sorting domain-containing protein [Ignavibacteria bacterium]
MNHITFKTKSIFTNSVLAVILIFLVNIPNMLSQDKQHSNDNSGYSYSSSNDVNNQVLTSVPNNHEFSTEKQALINELCTARLSGNTTKAVELQARLDQMTGVSSPEFVNNPSETGIEQTQQQFIPDGDGISVIGSNAYWAIATQTSSRSNCIFAAVSEYVASSSDQIKIFVSYNNGITWIQKGVFSGFSPGVRLYNEELDIEPVIYGNDTLVYAVAGYVYNGNRFSLIARFNIGTGAEYSLPFSYSSSTTKNYNPRITSDNSYYSSNPYVYITVSNDTATSSGHLIRQRFCLITSPFSTPFIQSHRNPSNGGFYWIGTSGAAFEYMYQDVGYFRNTIDNTDNIYTAVIFSGASTAYYNIYTAWSKDYAGTIGGNIVISETTPTSRVRLAFNGGTNMTGSMTYLRNYTLNAAGDVDVKSQNTLTGGYYTNSWTSSYLEFTSDTATSCDIQAVKLAPNKFKYAYSLRGGRCFYTANTSPNTYYPRMMVNNIPAGEGYGRVRAGYRVTSSDSCLAVWSGNTGGGLYSTYGCTDYTAVVPNSNEVPTEYALKQNYPNPFNPVTNIKFSVPQASFVKLVVYDITGKEVAKLVNNNMTAGSYTVDFNASGLSSGVYFYRIDTDGFSDVKKMMLIK